jgi:hypothetical protein
MPFPHGGREPGSPPALSGTGSRSRALSLPRSWLGHVVESLASLNVARTHEQRSPDSGLQDLSAKRDAVVNHGLVAC